MKVLCVLCALCGLAVSLRALDRGAFTFTRYDLNLRVEPEQHRLAVRGKVTLRNDSNAPQKDLSLQISSSLDWRSITLAGKRVQFLSQPYTSDIDHSGVLSEAIVSLPQAIPPQGTIELEIGYEGVVVLDTTRLTRIGVPEDDAKHTDWDQIGASFTAVRGLGYVVWYPVAMEAVSLTGGNEFFDALAQWKLRQSSARMDADLCVALSAPDTRPPVLWMNDSNRGQTSESEGYACSKHSFARLENLAPMFAAGEFSSLTRPEVEILYLAGRQAGAEQYANSLGKVAPFVAAWFGVPHRKCEVVDLGDSAGAPYETGAMMVTPLDAVDPEPSAIAAVHQLTHVVFPSPREWIYEGLAHFAQALYWESQAGRSAALASMGAQLKAVQNTEKSLAERNEKETAEPLIRTSLEEFYRSKAMYVWWMLRDLVGDTSLKKALANYRPDQDKEPSYMQRLIQAETHTDLEWFFDDWVYRDRGLPDFRVAAVYPRQTMRGNYMVTVTIENLGGAGAEVPVILRSKEGEERKRLEVRAKSRSSIRFEVPSLPEEAVVNDGSVPESDTNNNVLKVQPGAESR
jgi:hypothetical protein